MKTFKLTIYIIAFALLISFINSCASLNTKKIKKEKTYLDSTIVSKDSILKLTDRKDYPSENEYPDADAVILYEKNVSEFTNQNATIYQKTLVTKIFKNITDQSSLTIPLFYRDSLISFRATVINDTNKTFLNSSDLITTKSQSADSSVGYKTLTMIFPTIKENSIIEYQYSILRKNIFEGTTWYIQEDNVPKLYIEMDLAKPATQDGYMILELWYKLLVLKMSIPKYYMWSIDLNNIDLNPNPDTLKIGDVYYSSWKFKNIPAFNSEPMMPPINLYKAKLDFGPYSENGWEEVADYYKFFYDKGTRDTDNVSYYKALADSITTGSKDELQKIKLLSKFVQKLRYENVPYGREGSEPRNPREVCQSRYGDCKDKSGLLITLLKAEDIKANPAILLTSDKGEIDQKFPKTGFNHMIVDAKDHNKHEYWIDPTVTFCKLGNLPYYDEGVSALVLYDNDTYEFAKIPASEFQYNSKELMEKIKINADFSANADIKLTFNGQEDLIMRNSIAELNNLKIKEFIKSLLKNKFINVSVDSIKTTDFENTDEDFTITFNVKIDNFINNQSGLFLVDYDILDDDISPNLLVNQVRKYPIDNRFKFMEKKVITVDYPDSLICKSKPDDILIHDNNFSFSQFVVNETQNRFSVEKEFKVRTKIIPEYEYPDFQKFFSDLNKANSGIVVLQKK